MKYCSVFDQRTSEDNSSGKECGERCRTYLKFSGVIGRVTRRRGMLGRITLFFIPDSYTSGWTMPVNLNIREEIWWIELLDSAKSQASEQSSHLRKHLGISPLRQSRSLDALSSRKSGPCWAKPTTRQNTSFPGRFCRARPGCRLPAGVKQRVIAADRLQQNKNFNDHCHL